MSRPELISDVSESDRRVQVATFAITEFSTNPAMISAYGAFLTALEASGGYTENSYGTISAYRLKAGDELESALSTAQSAWDRHEQYYRKLEAGEDFEHSYQRDMAIAHAKKEGYTLPEGIK